MIALMMAVFGFLISVINTDVKVSYKVYSDVKYGSRANNTMDVYIPETAYKVPENGMVIFLHGGSWYKGDKKTMKNDCIKTAQNGYVCATMNYSFIDEDNYSIDMVLNEVTAAIKKVKSYCADKKIKINKVAVSGFSAGAHIALLYSYKRAQSCPLKLCFVASKSGPTDFHEDKLGFMALVLSGDYTKYDFSNMTQEQEDAACEKMVLKVSPLNYVTKNSVPTIIAHGKLDKTVPYSQATSLNSKLNKCGVTHKFITFADSGHSLDKNEDSLNKYYKTLKEYCRTYF